MDDESQGLQKSVTENSMDTDEGPLINENSNGLSHLLTEGEFNSVDASAVDESSVSNQGFLNAVELSADSDGDYLTNNTDRFNRESFDVEDNAVTFPSDNLLSDGESQDIVSSNYRRVTTDSETGMTDNENVVNTRKILEQEVIFNVDSNDTNDTNDVIVKIGVGSAEENSTELTERTEKVEPSVEEVKHPIEEMEVGPDNDSKNIDGEIGDTNQNVVIKTIDTAQNKANDSVKDVEIKIVINQNSDGDLTANSVEDSETNDIKDEVKESAENSKPETLAEVGGAEETEVVSEDELPLVQKPSIKDAENVSDDELPGPKPAELPADTEVVSEDELPTSKKDPKRKRKSDTEKDDDTDFTTDVFESSSKKQAVAKNGESKPIPSEKRSSTEETPKKKPLPELDKYWKVVNDEPTDFTGWTYLLQYVDQESDVEAAREAYDAFLSHYPYCYGYWRKYADYEKRKGSKKKCLEVLERGLKAIPLSVDLWIHYLNHIMSTRTDDHSHIRQQFERALEACGLEFRSDRLWSSYIKWESENGSALHVTHIYDRLLSTPTLGYTSHFDNFQEHVMSEPPAGLVERDELVKLRNEVREASGVVPQLDLPPGEDEPDDHIASEEEGQAIKERIIAARRKIHKSTGEEVAARWSFEEGIKRPYFHVKPLERCQLKNWKAYLEWEKQHGSFKRILVLHERCLIACALYEEFWLRLVRFLEEKSAADPKLVQVERGVLERACTVHHLDKPELHLHWAHFEEINGNVVRSAEILERIEKACPNLVQIQYRRINLERRRGEFEKCSQLYENYISSAKNKAIASSLSIKFARFLFHVNKNTEKAITTLEEAITKDPLNQRLYLQLLDLSMNIPGTPYSKLEEIILSYEKQEGAELDVCASLAWQRRELAEELGDIAACNAAYEHLRVLARHLRKRARKDKHENTPPSNNTDSKKKESESKNSSSSTSASNTANLNTYYQAPPTPSHPYDQNYGQPYGQPPWGYQQPPGNYHQPPWPQYTNYY